MRSILLRFFQKKKIWDLDGRFRQVERRNHITGRLQGFCVIRPLYKAWAAKSSPQNHHDERESISESRKVVTLKFSTCQITLSFLQLSVLGRFKPKKTCFDPLRWKESITMIPVLALIHQTKNYKLGLDFLSFYVNKAL